MAENQGPRALAIMWAMTILTWIFVGLRVLTRAIIVQVVGADDYVYLLSAIFLLCYNIFLQISLRYGFGQNVGTLELEDIAKAIKMEMIGQTFAVIGMAVAKASMGLFLLRLVAVRWHKVAIWSVMGALLLISGLTAIMFWVQCLPSKGIWDPRERPNSRCDIEITPFAVTLGVACIVADFFFAIFPSIFIWQLNMRRREKITIAGSMSLGLIAGAAGIVRTYEVATGFTENYTQDTVPLIIWSSVEMAVTMVCIGIPVTMPLWRLLLGKGSSSADRNYRKYKRHDDGSEPRGYPLDNVDHRRNVKSPGHIDGSSKLGLNCTQSTDIRAMTNESDEEILPNKVGDTIDRDGVGLRVQSGIHVRDEVRVERNH
ncbi:hypothetical protein CC79DRAFT_1396368 [Sarocladium strictum]